MKKTEILKNIIEAETLDKIFAILNKDARVNALAIYEKNGDKYDLKLFRGKSAPNFDNNAFSLTIRKVEWAKLVFDTSNTDRQFLELISAIISEKVKITEIHNLMSRQISLLQEGIIDHESEVTARTTFFAKVTHDLRTPLNSIIGYCGLLRDEVAGKLNKIQKNYLLDIESSAVSLLNIINDILDFSKISAKKSVLTKTDFDIKQIFFEAENIVKPLLCKKNQKLITICDNFKLNADYQKTLSIIVNLLSNSIKYSDENTVINLSSQKTEKRKIIEIKDNGIGIPKNALKRICKAFMQGKNNKNQENSTGLGLAIVQNFVKMHGWEMDITSDINEGTTIRIYVS